MTNTFSYASYCDARSRFHKTATIGLGHGYIRFGDCPRPSPKILFLVVGTGDRLPIEGQGRATTLTMLNGYPRGGKAMHGPYSH